MDVDDGVASESMFELGVIDLEQPESIRPRIEVSDGRWAAEAEMRAEVAAAASSLESESDPKMACSVLPALAGLRLGFCLFLELASLSPFFF